MAARRGRAARRGCELQRTELAERIKRERADAAQQTEQRLRQEFELKLQAAHAPIAGALRIQ
jgi:sRNA-binding carbon storage regulator CsrA